MHRPGAPESQPHPDKQMGLKAALLVCENTKSWIKEKTSWPSHLNDVHGWYPAVVVVVVLRKLWKEEGDDSYEEAEGLRNDTVAFFIEHEDVSALV